jgi:hypothetical protein
MTITDFAATKELGVRSDIEEAVFADLLGVILG